MNTIDEIVTKITFANWGTAEGCKIAVLREYVEQVIEECALIVGGSLDPYADDVRQLKERIQ